ncbi:MMPL family transporter [Conexibacter sp. W3-3-2]|uniref:MMPL family transporter n=1 Tax=Conexibacter sp. W3-3-2 TaxID=2675227 RepID=UPI0012B7A2FE|nr:MMPL family transporter [Conexibacter sp. W3-3-2]MTD43746.1 MMPL family transporter [Conexibacter sp. W3-3-2]
MVVLIWCLLAAGLATQFPRLHDELSGAGWEALGSESVDVRAAVEEDFDVPSSYAVLAVVQSDAGAENARDTAIRRASAVLRADPAIAGVSSPKALGTISPDGRTAIVVGRAGAGTAEMVRAADRLRDRLGEIDVPGARVMRTGLPAQWADFNDNHGREAQKAELIALPVTMVILLLAFGSLAAAGLPLLLTVIGLSISGGLLVALAAFGELSIWSQNFASIFTLALGIDYALFIVMRFRAALRPGIPTTSAVATTMDTAGKAVLFSGLTVLSTLMVILVVPNTMLRSVAIGILISVSLVLAMVLTLLPVVLNRLGHGIDRFPLPWRKAGSAHRSQRLAAWGAQLWAHPLRYGVPAVVLMLALTSPALGMKVGVPDLGLLPADAPARTGAEAARTAFGPGALGPVQVIGPASETARIIEAFRTQPALGPASQPASDGDGNVLVQAPLTAVRTSDDAGRAVASLRAAIPAQASVGGVVAEVKDFQDAVNRITPYALGVMLLLAFALMLVAFQAPVVALLATASSALSTGAAFGVTVLIFQEGHLSGLFGFQPQGFIDFWVPLLFFAMIFAITMDYTVFLLSATREHWDNTGDARAAVIESVARSGPVIIAAASVMVGVFFSFTVADSLAAKECGAVLGIAVLLDAFLVRLLVLPVALRLLGPLAWRQPVWLGRILPSVSFGHGEQSDPEHGPGPETPLTTHTRTTAR